MVVPLGTTTLPHTQQVGWRADPNAKTARRARRLWARVFGGRQPTAETKDARTPSPSRRGCRRRWARVLWRNSRQQKQQTANGGTRFLASGLPASRPSTPRRAMGCVPVRAVTVPDPRKGRGTERRRGNTQRYSSRLWKQGGEEWSGVGGHR